MTIYEGSNCPSFREYEKRFKELKRYRNSCKKGGKPKHLLVHYGMDFKQKFMTFDEMKDATIAMGRSREPSGCKGVPSYLLPNKRRTHKGKFACDKPWVCLHCWHQQREVGGVRGFLRFAGLKGVQSLSMNLFDVDYNQANKARIALRKVLQKGGATHIWLNIHITGDVPTEGLKYGIDGLFWGENALKNWDKKSLLKSLEPYQQTPHGLIVGRRLHTRTLANKPLALLNRCKYSGRCTYDLRRMVAGQFLENGYPAVAVYHTNKENRNRYGDLSWIGFHDWVDLHANVVEAYKATRKALRVGPTINDLRVARRQLHALYSAKDHFKPLPKSFSFPSKFPLVDWP